MYNFSKSWGKGRASKFFGANLVGIAPYNKRCDYDKWCGFSKTFYDESKKPLHEEAEI